MNNLKVTSKKLFWFAVGVLVFSQCVSAGMFNIFNGKIYKEKRCLNCDMFPSDPPGSLDDFFLGDYNG